MSGAGRDWRDRRFVDRGARERAADTRRRIAQEQARAALDRAVRDTDLDDADVVVADGPTARAAPPVDVIDDVLQALIERRGWGERLRGASLDRRWSEVVGVDLATRCRPGRLAGGVLQVVVESPLWATQLRYLAGQIAGRASAVVGSEIREVTVVVGSLDAEPPSG